MIALSSIAGVIGFPGLAPYVASKHAVYGLVKSVSMELAENNIRVNAIGPGPIANRMTQSIEEQMAPGDSNAAHEAIEALIPMKRYGTNEDIANMALFLASDEANYCTGSIHMVDGGYVAG